MGKGNASYFPVFNIPVSKFPSALWQPGKLRAVVADGQAMAAMYHPNRLGRALRGRWGILVIFCKRCDVFG
jgi:hypothetical protein